jgi:hypothetical protein
MKPAIVLAAEASNVYAAARLYAAMGLSVLPCIGKRPALRTWAHLQQQRATTETIDAWQRVGLIENIGVICGRVSRGLVVIDLDGDLAVNRFEAIFPELTDTYCVASGSGHGQHYYYYCGDVPPTTRFMSAGGNIELRAGGCYVVAPPSIHPDSSLPYTVVNPVAIQYVRDLNAVVKLLRELSAEKRPPAAPPASAQRVYNRTAYGMAALKGEAATLTATSDGGRNSQLFRSALKMGSLIADGHLDHASAERALFDAATACGLVRDEGENEVMRQIENGIANGMGSSREQYNRA